MYIYVDTEFTDLPNGSNDPKLISIGCVADDGKQFYGIVDYDVNECSLFVMKEVLPLLRGVPDPATRLNFNEFVEQYEEPTFVADYYLDLLFARELLTEENRNKAMFMMAKDPKAWSNKDHWFDLNPARIKHNALDDALALQYALNN